MLFFGSFQINSGKYLKSWPEVRSCLCKKTTCLLAKLFVYLFVKQEVFLLWFVCWDASWNQAGWIVSQCKHKMQFSAFVEMLLQKNSDNDDDDYCEDYGEDNDEHDYCEDYDDNHENNDKDNGEA